MEGKKQIVDNFGRPINYLRLAVTDRCNLRCFYCMPAKGMKFSPKKELLSYEEMLQLIDAAAGIGINKIRITGGEPFLKKDIVYFLEQAKAIKGIDTIAITTNGVVTHHYIDDLKRLNIKSINLSLDTLDEEKFFQITRKNVFPQVMDTMHQLIAHDFDLKINAVVMAGKNTDDILPLVAMTEHKPISVRFIEEMPFNGSGSFDSQQHWTYKHILDRITSKYPTLEKIGDPAHSTALHYKIPGFMGNVGIIPAWSRTFCGSCNRIRVTAKGILKTCLYDKGENALKPLFLEGASKETLQQVLMDASQKRHKDGFEAAKEEVSVNSARESMSSIGG